MLKDKGYPKIHVYIHWLTLILIICVYISIEFRGVLGEDRMFHDIMKSLHFYIGFLILFLTVFRLISRYGFKVVEFDKSKLLLILAKVVHIFLYLWLLVLPVLGWVILSAKGSNIPFGLFPISPKLTKINIKILEEIHEYLAYAGFGVIFLHALAGLYNHYFLVRK